MAWTGERVEELASSLRKRIDRDFRNGIEAKHKIGREAAVQVRERVIPCEPVNDVPVREGWQAVELNVAVGTADDQERTTNSLDAASLSGHLKDRYRRDQC